MRIVRRLNAVPTGPFDLEATLAFAGDGSATVAALAITGFLPDVPGSPSTHHYVAYGCRRANECEPAGVHAALTPTLPDVLRGGG